jgi:hypothetical protein
MFHVEQFLIRREETQCGSAATKEISRRGRGAENSKDIADRLLCAFAPLREILFWLRRKLR